MKNKSIYRIVFPALMAAIVFAATSCRIPLLGSKVHLGNAACLLSGLLLGGPFGGLAAGLGSMLNDLMLGEYGMDECLITFASKFLMAFFTAVIAGRKSKLRLTVSCWCGAFSYVLLYMFKTYLYRRYVYGYSLDAVWATMLSKLPASVINAVFAAVVTPILYAALVPALKKSGLLEKL